MTTSWTFSLTPTPPDWQLDWPAILSELPFLAPLSACPQEPDFHAEGDVLIHTRMVCEALIALEPWRNLDPTTRSILFVAALLHDLAKPLCTDTDATGRITSKGHALKGSHLYRAFAYRADPAPLAAPFAVREQIASLIRYHGLPLSFLDKIDPIRAILTTSQSIRCDLLALLARADAMGRICTAKDQLLQRTTLFQDFCREQNCLTAARPFASDHSRFTYFTDGKSGPDYIPYDDTRCQVHVVCGLPGAGKDSQIRQNLSHLPVISLDALRHDLDINPDDDQGKVIAAAKDRARELLRAGKDFVWNATNVTVHLRKPLVTFFTSYHARINITYIEAPYSTLITRNSAARVPRKVIERLIDKIDIPAATEAHCVRWIA